MEMPHTPQAWDCADVLTFGEAMALFIAQSPGPLHEVQQFCQSVAGAELNVAIGLSRLGFNVDYLSAVGDDSFGHVIRHTLWQENIGTQHIHIDSSRSTGFMLKSCVTDGSDPLIEYHRKGSAASAMHCEDFRFEQFPAKHLHLTGIALALSPQTREVSFELARRARAAGARISFDPNLRPQLWKSQQEMIGTINALAGLCDIVLPGIEEGRLLTGYADAHSISRFYLDLGAATVVTKLGGQGAFCLDRHSMTTPGYQVAGIPVATVVDTVGAGDGFAVGVISGLLDGLSIQEAALRGNQIASRVIQFPGDSTGLPNRQELAAIGTNSAHQPTFA